MRTWISAPSLALAVLIASLGSICADQACTRIQQADVQAAGTISTYTKKGIPWKVTVDLRQSSVTVENTRSHASCRFVLDDLAGVYFSESTLLLLRSTQVASDDVHFFDAATCRKIRAPVSVFAESDADANRKLAAAGYCLSSEPANR